MRTRSVAWSELKLGIAGVVAIALVTVLVLAVGGQGGFFWQRYPLKARFDDVQGLKTGALVRLNGMDVGKVTAIDFAGAEVEVGLTVTKSVRHLITSDSRAAIGSLSLLGEPIIDIHAAATGAPLADGMYLTTHRGGGINGMAATASRGVSEATQLVADLRAGRGAVGRLLTDDEIYRELDALLETAGRVSHQLESGDGTLGSLLHDRTAYNALNATLAELRAITARINAGVGPLGRLVTDDSLSGSLAASSRNVEQITGRLARGEGTAGRLLADTVLYTRIDTMVMRLDRLLVRMEAGEGSAGRLLHDDRLYENLDEAATELRGLLADIRRDPKKYLHVRVGIF
jgi:phospholipid/cholesterol/gamma-HCH transport system substrate-binding protein